MKNGDYNTKDVRKQCEVKLNIEFRKSGRSDHDNGWYIYEGKKAARITVAKGRKPIPRGTYKSMAKQLMLTISQFDDLLDCPLTKDGYDKILTDIIPSKG
jgi:hypothetical protein